MNRSTWLIRQIKKYDYKVGAEIGVQRGNNLFKILQEMPELEMYAVDIWSDKQVRFDGTTDLTDIKPNSAYQYVKSKKIENPERLHLIRDFSHQAYAKFNDKSLDFIFIDASHVYEDVKKDIELWYPKVKEGGMISGHDINMKGVSKAVSESINDWSKAGHDNVWYKIK